MGDQIQPNTTLTFSFPNRSAAIAEVARTVENQFNPYTTENAMSSLSESTNGKACNEAPAEVVAYPGGADGAVIEQIDWLRRQNINTA